MTDGVCDFEETRVFFDKADAEREFYRLKECYKKDVADSGFVVEEGSLSYEAYEEGCYANNHVDLLVRRMRVE